MRVLDEMPMPRQAVTNVRAETTMSPEPNRHDARPQVVDPTGDEAELFQRVDELLDAMEHYVAEHHGRDGASWRSGDFTAGAMLEFKARHGDGLLTQWTVADLREFLLVWFPAFVHTDDDVLHDMPASAAAFFDFLAHAGSLTGDPLDELKTACEGLSAEFLAACRDPQRWSPAKSRLIAISGDPPAPSR